MKSWCNLSFIYCCTVQFSLVPFFLFRSINHRNYRIKDKNKNKKEKNSFSGRKSKTELRTLVHRPGRRFFSPSFSVTKWYHPGLHPRSRDRNDTEVGRTTLKGKDRGREHWHWRVVEDSRDGEPSFPGMNVTTISCGK